LYHLSITYLKWRTYLGAYCTNDTLLKWDWEVFEVNLPIDKRSSVILNQVTNRGEKPRGRKAILSALVKAAEEGGFLPELSDIPSERFSLNYTLTREELAALTSGDTKKIEGWVGKLDKEHAALLWCWLSRRKS